MRVVTCLVYVVRWYPVVLDLHRFFIDISRDGNNGTAPDPMVWSAGALPKRRRLVHAVRDLAMLLGPPAFWLGGWVAGPAVDIGAEDVAQCGPTLLVFWSNGLPSLVLCIGLLLVWILGLVVSRMLDCLFFTSYGLERGCPWKGLILGISSTRESNFSVGCSVLVQALIFGVPVVSLVLLCGLFAGYLGGWGGLSPCSIGANHCRLRHIGWEKCGHGLTSRPRETALEPFLDELLQLFHYPPRSARALLAGTLPFRYCAARFASGAPTWRLPVSGHVARLVTADLGVADGKRVEDASREVHSFRGSGPGRKRIRPNRKPPAHLAGFGVQSRPRVWKRLRHVGLSVDSSADYRRRRYEQRDDGNHPVQSRTDVG